MRRLESGIFGQSIKSGSDSLKVVKPSDIGEVETQVVVFANKIQGLFSARISCMTTGLADPANGHIANRFNLADEACEDALYDMAVIREFCRIDLSCARGAGILR